MVSQPVQALEIFTSIWLESPPLAARRRRPGGPPGGESLCSEFDIFPAHCAESLCAPSALFPFSGETSQRLGSITLRDRLAGEDRAVSSNHTPSATNPSRTALSRDFVARKREEFAAS
jgi:hypothetical protein